MDPIQSRQPFSLVLPQQSLATATQQSTSQLLPFHAGAIYQALVVKGGTGEILLDIMGRNILATTSRTIDTGQQLSLQVQTTTPRIELKVLDSSLPTLLAGRLSVLSSRQEGQQPLSALTPEAVSAFSLKKEAARLLELFRSVQGDTTTPVNGEKVRQIMEKSGLGLEADLAMGRTATPNLKNVALELAARAEPLRTLANTLLPLLSRGLPDTTLAAQQMSAKDTLQVLQTLNLFIQEHPLPQNILEQKIIDIARILQGLSAAATQENTGQTTGQLKELQALLTTAGEVATEANTLVQRLETFQLLQVRLDQTDTIFFPLFFPFLSEGYLLIDREKAAPERTNSAGMRLTLLLALSGLGDMQIDLLQEPGGIAIRFFLDTMEKARFMATFEQELYQAFDTLPIRALSFSAGARPPPAGSGSESHGTESFVALAFGRKDIAHGSCRKKTTAGRGPALRQKPRRFA